MSPKQESLSERIEELAEGLGDYAQHTSDGIAEDLGRPGELGPCEPWATWSDDLRSLAAEVAELEGKHKACRGAKSAAIAAWNDAEDRILRAEARVEKLEEALRDSEERCERNHVHFSRLCSTCKRKISQREKRRSEALRNQEGEPSADGE